MLVRFQARAKLEHHSVVTSHGTEHRIGENGQKYPRGGEVVPNELKMEKRLYSLGLKSLWFSSLPQ